ncbi:MAG: sigma-70 family RNA polymerase sigma factor [Pseudomonadota bacterium]
MSHSPFTSGDLAAATEPDLCRRAAEGHVGARQALYSAHAAGVMTLAMRLLCERAAAEDVVQDTFMKAFEKLHTFSGQSRFGTWLRRIAINECLQRLRSPWHTRGEVYEESDAPAGSTDDQLDLLKALATLDPVSRTVVWLHDVEGFKHREIADLLDRTPSFSKSRLARAHKALRTALVAHERTDDAVRPIRTDAPRSGPAQFCEARPTCTPILKSS